MASRNIAGRRPRPAWGGWLVAALLPLFIVVPALTEPLETRGLDAAYYHIYRGVLFSAARAEGWAYPRWSPDLNAGLGGPLFTFYPPLLYFALDALNALGLPHPLGWRLLAAGGVLAASLGMFALGRALWNRDDAALVAAALFTYSPYLLFDLLERGSPQALAAALCPAVFWALWRWVEAPSGGRLAAAAGLAAAVLLFHNLATLLLLPAALAFGALLLARHGWRAVRGLALAALATCWLIAFYVLPYVAEQSAVVVDEAPPSWADPALNPMKLSTLLARPAVFDVGFDLNRISEAPGWVPLAALAASPFVAGVIWRRGRSVEAALVAGLGLIAGLLCWLQLDAATWVWEAAPFLLAVQFRSRLLLGLGLMAALVAGYGIGAWAPAGRAQRWARGVFAAGLMGAAVLTAWPALYVSLLHPYNAFSPAVTPAEARAFMQRTSLYGLTSTREFLPRWRTLPFSEGERAQVEATPIANLPAGARASTLSRTARDWRIEVETPSAFEAALHQLYYPAWQATVNEAPAALAPMPETGYALVAVPAGRSLIHLRYAGAWAAPTGEWASAWAAGLLFLAAGLWRGPRGEAHTAAAPLPAAVGSAAAAVLLAILAVKTGWIDPHTTWLRRTSTCEATYGAERQVEVQFGETFRLCGVRLDTPVFRAGEPVNLTLFWEVQARGDSPLVFAHLFGDTGDLPTAPKVSQHNNHILGSLPAVDWQPGRLYRETIELATGADIPRMAYVIEVGLWDPATGERRPPAAVRLAEGVSVSPYQSLIISGITAEAP